MHQDQLHTRPRHGARTLGRRSGRRRSTIDDVARLAGVSKGAVSIALNGHPGVADATRARISEAARTLSWRPSLRAHALLASRSFALGMVISRPPELLAADPFFPAFIAGVESVLASRGLALVLQVVDGSPEAEAASYRRLAHEGRVDGVFLTDLRIDDPRFAWLTDLDLPGVAIGRPSAGGSLPWLETNDREGIRAAVRHLVALGHRRIAHVGGAPGYVHSVARRRVWADELRANGLQPSLFAEGDFTGEGGAAATRHLLALRQAPTAIVYANDLMAIAGMSVAIDAGLTLPDELSVVGFDDIPLAAHVRPALTTVRRDATDWGRAAALSLVALVEGEPMPDVTLTPVIFIERASTSAPPGA
ncbi:MAG: LacI family transcriptional regulator [Chloroflexi bacterium]|nr:MAG: LacI family transcriptional regulator [Chloroflexota bacterium]